MRWCLVFIAALVVGAPAAVAAKRAELDERLRQAQTLGETEKPRANLFAQFLNNTPFNNWQNWIQPSN